MSRERKPRCSRCGRRLAKDTRSQQARWNVVTRNGGQVVGHHCWRCQTDAEDTEAQVAEAALEYHWINGRLMAMPKPDLDDETREFALKWIEQSKRQQRAEGTW